MDSKDKKYQELVKNCGKRTDFDSPSSERDLPLGKQIERQKLDDKCGSYDADTSELVFAFLRSVRDTFSTPALSVESAEIAKQSLVELQALRSQVIQHRKTARALRHILEGQKLEEEARLIQTNPFLDA